MRIALGQIDVTDDPVTNLAAVHNALAASPEAELAVFPEATQVRFGNRLAAFAQPVDGPFVTGLRAAATEHRTAVVAGFFEAAEDDRVHNTTVAIHPDGELAGVYRKIHLFDAFSHRESDTVAPGEDPAVVELAGTRIGLATCYDLRFPELFRALVDGGAELFVIPAAWAPGSLKEEHWATLVRARAIENTMWTVAVGKALELTDPPHGGRTGIGRSMLVDPFGTVRADLGPYPSTATVEIDPAVTEHARRVLPALDHRRLG